MAWMTISMAGFLRRGGWLAGVAALFLFVAVVGAQTPKYVATEAKARSGAFFNGVGVADLYDKLAKGNAVTAVGLGKGEALSGIRYIIANNSIGVGYSVRKTDSNVEYEFENGTNLSSILDNIKVDASGMACDIQLGYNSDTWLEIGSSALIFDGEKVRNVKWGEIKLSGKLSSMQWNSSDQIQDIVVSHGASVVSSVEIRTRKAVSVQVEDSSEFTYMGAINASCGNIRNVGTYGSSVTVVSGSVSYIDNEGTGYLEVIGGTVGSIARYGYAIKNGEMAETVISGDAEVLSGDTGYGGGTILNHGVLEISGGLVKNGKTSINGNSTAINNGTSYGTVWPSIVKITGTAKISANNNSTSQNVAMITNTSGELRISGGIIENDNPLAGSIITSYGKLIISDSAWIKSGSTNNSNRVIYCYNNDSITSGLSITGGTIIANEGGAVYVTGSGRVDISDDATIIGNSSKSPVILMGSLSHLYLNGGTIKSMKAKSDSTVVAIRMNPYSSGGYAATLEMGGTPIVEGTILMMNRTNFPINIKTGSGDKFNPIDNIYRIVTSNLDSNDLIVEGGAGFNHNFVLQSANDTRLKLAVSGKDIVAVLVPSKVTFSLNGPISGTPLPEPIWVASNKTISDQAMPPAMGYISKNGYYSDTIWYIRSGMAVDGSDIPNIPFRFDDGSGGTVVKEDMVLTLRWTDKKANSVLESPRDLPAPRPSESAAVAPIAAVSGSLTAGPNPVSSSIGAVSFFRSGAALKDGKLFIYDASGNMVTTVIVNDNRGGANRRIVAKWDLTDAKGRAVVDGSYVARGVVATKAGKTERVSVLVSVQR